MVDSPSRAWFPATVFAFKIMKKITAFCLLAFLAGNIRAQGLDVFAVPRPIVLATPKAIGGATLTNGPIDTHGYLGTAVMVLTASTNVYSAVTNFSAPLPLALIVINTQPSLNDTLTISHNATNQVWIWTNDVALPPCVQIGAAKGSSATNLYTALTAYYAGVTKPATNSVLMTGQAGDVLLTAISSIAGVTNWNYSFYATTNISPVPTGTLTATLQESPDTVTWTDLARYAIGTSSSLVVSNLAAGGVATNVCLLPGVWTTPTASSAGSSTPYMTQAAFTNTGALDLIGSPISEIGFRVQPKKGYLQVVWTATGYLTSNSIVSAVFNGVRGGEVQ